MNTARTKTHNHSKIIFALTSTGVDADVVNVNVDGVTDTMEDQASADTDAKISDQLKTTGIILCI